MGRHVGYYSVRIEVVDGQVVRTDLGPAARDDYFGPESPTIDDVFDLLDQAQASADTVNVDFDPDFSFPIDVSVDHLEEEVDDEYRFGIAGFEVIEARPPDP